MYNSSNSNSNNTRGVKRTLRAVNAPTAKMMMTKRFRNKVNNEVMKEAARYGITNLNATKVSLPNRGLTRIPDFIFYMKNLQSLDLSGNRNLSLPASIGQLKNLQELDLCNTRLTSLPTTIGRLRNLKRFHICTNYITRLPSAIGELKKLEVLDISDNKLTSLPESIGELKKLVMLSADNNKFTSLPESIGELKKLRWLGLMYNELTSLPESIGQLRNLERLDIVNQKLTKLPASFGKLKKLKDLFINLYKLISIPKTFENLSDSLVIMTHGGKKYTKQQFMKQFEPKRINKNTELLNASFLPTNNIPRGKRAYISTPSNIKNNGTLRRVYNKNGLNEALRIGEGSVRLHGNYFSANNVRLINNKNFNLQRIRVRLLNTPLNNMRAAIEGMKNNLPPNVSRTDVNNVAKPLVLNRLRTTPENQRQALLNMFKRDGLINNRTSNI